MFRVTSGLSSVGLFCGVSSLICVKKLCQQMAAGILSGHGQNVFSRCQFDTSLRNRVDSNFPDSVIEVARKLACTTFIEPLLVNTLAPIAFPDIMPMNSQTCVEPPQHFVKGSNPSPFVPRRNISNAFITITDQNGVVKTAKVSERNSSRRRNSLREEN